MNQREYRLENGLCVNCGEPADANKTRCWRCLQIECVKAKARYENLTPEEKQIRYAREQAWRKMHPKNVAVYKNKQTEYNKRYNERRKKAYEL